MPCPAGPYRPGLPDDVLTRAPPQLRVQGTMSKMLLQHNRDLPLCQPWHPEQQTQSAQQLANQLLQCCTSSSCTHNGTLFGTVCRCPPGTSSTPYLVSWMLRASSVLVISQLLRSDLDQLRPLLAAFCLTHVCSSCLLAATSNQHICLDADASPTLSADLLQTLLLAPDHAVAPGHACRPHAGDGVQE